MRPRRTSLVLAVASVLALTLPVWAGAKYRVLHDFGSGSDGYGPFGPLVLDSKGNLYGVTGTGGDGCPGGCGTVFELTPLANGHWKEAILYSFPGGDYSYPWGALTFG